MATIKTTLNTASVEKYLKAIPDAGKREDCLAIAALMEKVTKCAPEMWGTAIVGFGRRTVTYANGKQAEWMTIGFAPRKQNIALYGLKFFHVDREGLKVQEGENDHLLKLGKYKEGGGCLYINKLTDIDMKELEKIIRVAFRHKG